MMSSDGDVTPRLGAACDGVAIGTHPEGPVTTGPYQGRFVRRRGAPCVLCSGEELLDGGVGDAGGPGAEDVAFLARGQVGAEECLEGAGDAGCRQAYVDPVREIGRAAQASAYEEIEAIHLLAVVLDLHTLQPDVGDPMLAACVRATGDVDTQVLAEVRQPALEVRDEIQTERLGLDQRELAELRPGAGYDPSLERRRRRCDPVRAHGLLE